jgi:hypothetical protein
MRRFSVPPWFLDTARRIAKVREAPLDYVALRPSESVCAARAAARAEGKLTEYAAYSELYATFDPELRHLIEDDGSDAKAVAARIREGLNAGLFRLSESF